eukprot:433407-Pyramimonas_sp.AAC.1
MSGDPATEMAAASALCVLASVAAALPSAFHVLGVWGSDALPMPTMPTLSQGNRTQPTAQWDAQWDAQ